MHRRARRAGAVSESGVAPAAAPSPPEWPRGARLWLRVLEYRLKPGQKEPMHSHRHGFVYMLANARARVSLPDGSSSVLDEHAGDLTWRDLTTHAFENVGDTDVHAIGVELKPCTPQ